MMRESAGAARRDGDVQSFILCLWRESSGGRNPTPCWRLSLEESRTHARRGFGSLDEFFAYLERFCEEVDGGAP